MDVKKLIFILFASIFVLSGCESTTRHIEASTVCLQGVQYYITGYHLAPAFKPDGTLYTCKESNDGRNTI